MQILKYNLYVIPDVTAEVMGILEYYSATQKYLSLILGTIAAESGFEKREKENCFGLGLMSVSTATKVFESYLKENLARFHKFTKLWLGLESIPYFVPSNNEMKTLLLSNDRFAIALIYSHYNNLDKYTEPIRESISEQSHYYVCHYNNAGTVQNFLESMERYSINGFLKLKEML